MIIGLHDDMITATEYRYDGPTALNLGIYGISLATQKIVWTSHHPKPWGRFLRVLDFIPGFANEFRDDPIAVRDGQVWTQAGRILDAKTGNDIGSLEWTPDLKHSVTNPTVALIIDGHLDCGEFGTLHTGTLKSPKAVRGDRPVRLYLQDKTGSIVWEFDASKFKEIGEPHYAGLGIHYLAPYIYLTVSDRPQRAALPGKDPAPVPSQFHLWTLDIHTGQIIQKVPISPAPLVSCGIADGDDAYLIVSCRHPDTEMGTLLCFARTPPDHGNPVH